jgi:hypothetical protein
MWLRYLVTDIITSQNLFVDASDYVPLHQRRGFHISEDIRNRFFSKDMFSKNVREMLTFSSAKCITSEIALLKLNKLGIATP